MPRFVRPAWIEVRGDYDSSSRGTGPRTRDGYLSARVTLRTASGDVSDPVTFDAGGQDDSGRARMVLDIPRGFVIELDGAEISTPDVSTSVHIVIRPALP